MKRKKPFNWVEAVGQPVDHEGLRMPDGGHMKAACRHRRESACAGCYARMATLLWGLEKGADPAALAKACSEAMQNDVRRFQRPTNEDARG